MGRGWGGNEAFSEGDDNYSWAYNVHGVASNSSYDGKEAAFLRDCLLRGRLVGSRRGGWGGDE